MIFEVSEWTTKALGQETVYICNHWEGKTLTDSLFRSLPLQFSSVTQSCLTLWPHGLQYARLPCSSPSPRACSNSCPVSQWYHPIILSSVIPFSSCLQSLRLFRVSILNFVGIRITWKSCQMRLQGPACLQLLVRQWCWGCWSRDGPLEYHFFTESVILSQEGDIYFHFSDLRGCTSDSFLLVHCKDKFKTLL